MPPKVNNACQRCRRLKLKCDAKKPCVLCTRGGVKCVAVDKDVWKVNELPQSRPKRRKTLRQVQPLGLSVPPSVGQHSHTDNGISIYQKDPSSSTTSLVEEVRTLLPNAPLRQINPVRTQTVPTPQLQVEQHSQADYEGEEMQSIMFNKLPETIFRGPSRRTVTSECYSSLRKELSKVLPPLEPGLLLVKTYFDRIHWFMLLFYQGKFLTRFTALYNTNGNVSKDCELGSLCTTLAVCALSLQYLGEYRASCLSAFGINCEMLQSKILEVLGRRLLDIIALESVEAVQTCVLLGTYYLFHGRPELAWPICGCGLRISQALKIHRKVIPDKLNSTEALTQFDHLVESRKRCWWAIYEVETFCCMLYGYPLSISDSDCDVEHLNLYSRPVDDTAVTGQGQNSDEPAISRVNLLHYKQLMSKLSVQIKAALGRMYTVNSNSSGPPCEPSSGPSVTSLHIQDCVKYLNSELDSWLSEYQSIFSTVDIEIQASEGYTDIEMDRDFGARGVRFDYHLFQLQRLILKFAFENARILVNRPLLRHGTNQRPSGAGSIGYLKATDTDESTAVTLCREAAMETSRLGDSPVFHRASKTYAVAFMSTHILTAGVTLCMLIIREPLSQNVQASKIGIHKLMKMQASLRTYSQQAEQGLEILKQLLGQVLKKESNVLFDLPGNTATDMFMSQDSDKDMEPAMSSMAPRLSSHNETSSQVVPNLPTSNCGVDPSVTRQPAGKHQSNAFDDHLQQNYEMDNTVAQSQTKEQPNNDLFDFTEPLFLDELKYHEQGWIWGFEMFEDLPVP